MNPTSHPVSKVSLEIKSRFPLDNKVNWEVYTSKILLLYLSVLIKYYFRKILRDEECLSLLLTQLRSPSLTIVSNACGTLWNFSARNKEDQEKLWELGAVPMLQSLTNSKHKTISTCSLAALKNLYTARPTGTVSRDGLRCSLFF